MPLSLATLPPPRKSRKYSAVDIAAPDTSQSPAIAIIMGVTGARIVERRAAAAPACRSLASKASLPLFPSHSPELCKSPLSCRQYPERSLYLKH